MEFINTLVHGMKKNKPTRKNASRRKIMIEHLLNKCKFKHISSLKIKLKHTALIHLAISEPVLSSFPEAIQTAPV